MAVNNPCYLFGLKFLRLIVSQPEILGPIDEMTSLSKMTSKNAYNYMVFKRSFTDPQKRFSVNIIKNDKNR